LYKWSDCIRHQYSDPLLSGPQDSPSFSIIGWGICLGLTRHTFKNAAHLPLSGYGRLYQKPLRVHFGGQRREGGHASSLAERGCGQGARRGREPGGQDQGRQEDGRLRFGLLTVIYRVPTFGSIFLASAISASASAVFFSCSNARPRL